ncbi:hypothetical protein DNTS_010293 [Danionella cerebrum]|uniref:Uncharacterized protein n=1 Tax=Danionella cerebrum TaxID=2873325 RepID=A0A553MRC8_9TELE|nr:hypothetical protein DNTS_010293 [Danionella translucida]
MSLDQTGSLTITNTSLKHGGPYLLQSRNGSETVLLQVHGSERETHLSRGDAIALSIGRAGLMRDEVIWWTCEEETIAELSNENNSFTVHEDVRVGVSSNDLQQQRLGAEPRRVSASGGSGERLQMRGGRRADWTSLSCVGRVQGRSTPTLPLTPGSDWSSLVWWAWLPSPSSTIYKSE